MARTALTRGRAEDALRTLELHLQSFPRGRLAEERDSLTIQALVSLGRHASARARAAQFRRKYPQSLLRPIVDHALRAIP